MFLTFHMLLSPSFFMTLSSLLVVWVPQNQNRWTEDEHSTTLRTFSSFPFTDLRRLPWYHGLTFSYQL